MSQVDCVLLGDQPHTTSKSTISANEIEMANRMPSPYDLSAVVACLTVTAEPSGLCSGLLPCDGFFFS